MTLETYIKGQIVAFAAHEGQRHGGRNNMVAIAQVIGNRKLMGWFGGDWLEILNHAPEVRGTVYLAQPLNARDPNFRALLQRVEEVYHATTAEDLTEGALYYAELHNINRDWFTAHITQQPAAHPRKAKVGEVTFFG